MRDRQLKFFRSKRRSGIAAAVVAGLTLSLISVPTAAFAAPSGAFDSLTLQKQSDGYSFPNNPVDSNGTNNIVAVNDFVGFRIQANTNAAVSEATVTLTKPTCFVWENTVDQNLTFTLDGGQTTGTVTHPDANTVTVTWTQAASGTVLTQPFRAKAGPTCGNGTTWAPTLTYTDASGTHSQTLDTITVRSVAGSDLRISAEGAPSAPANRWFSNLGTVPAIRQGWRIQLAPETLSSVGYSDPDGNVTFTVTFTGVGSAYELPRFNTGVLSACWSYETPSASNNGNYSAGAATQSIAITMKTTGACSGLLTQTNSIYLESFTPLSRVENAGCNVTHGAQVAAGVWTDTFGRPIPDNPLTNNSASVNLQCQEVAYGWSDAAQLIAPTQADASYDTYPRYNGGAAAIPTGNWASVGGAQIGAEGQFMSIAAASYDRPQLNDFGSYHFWDPTKQQVDLARLDKAVLGWLSPNSAYASTPMASSAYVRECTTGFDGSNANSATSLTWVDCTTLSADQINGLRFRMLAPLTNSGTLWSPNFANIQQVFSQVPFLAVGDPVVPTATTVRWNSSSFTTSDVATGTSNQLGLTNRGKTVSTTIIGNQLQINKTADVTQVQPEQEIQYTLAPQVVQPAGTFLPIVVPNLQVVDTLSAGVVSVDLSGLDPFWTVTQEPANLGPDGVPYTADDVSGMVLTFTPAGAVDTQTVIPPITYGASMGILLPPTTAPYNSTVVNTAVVSADYSSGNRTASNSIVAGTPEAAFFSKYLISDPVIEVEDVPAAWRVHWVNYNNYSLGQGRFVDVFPYDDDGRGTDFSGTISLSEIERVGSASQAGTVIELTADDPATVGASPAASTNWVTIDPSAAPSVWAAALGGEAPTAIRVTVPNIEASTQGYGAVDLRFEVEDQRAGNIYHNDASATVYNPVQGATVNLGTRSGDPVRVIGSSISGVAFVDKNSNGLREDDEPLLPNVPVKLFRAGHGPDAFRTTVTDGSGAYTFDNLHSSNPVVLFALTDYEYQVVFDVPGLTAMGYKLTTQLVDGGVSNEIDSDADETNGEVASLALGKDEHVYHLDAGVLAIGPQATITADASLDRTYNWAIEKSATNKSTLAVGADGAATIDYEATVSEVDYADSNAQLGGNVVITNPTDDKTYTINATVATDGADLICTVTNGTNRTLAPNASLTLPYTCAGLPGSDLDRTVTSTVTVVDQDPLGTTIPDLTPAVDTDYNLNEINKTVNVKDIASIGGVVQPATDFGPYTWGDDASGEYVENYTLDVTVPAGECLTVNNTATIVETGQNDSDSLTACLPLDLTVTKNVVTSMQTTYGWSIGKSLTNPDVTLDADGRATLDYEVVVTELAKQDSASAMSGVVTISNPNKYKAVEVSVTDVVTGVDGAPVCAFSAGSTVTLAADEVRALAYNCTFGSEPTVRDGANTATITWDSDVAGTNRDLTDTGKTASATATINAADWALTEFQKTVNVTDAMTIDGAAQAERSFGPYTWSAEGTTHPETYSVEVDVASGTCVLTDNTATLSAGSNVLGVATTSHTLCNEAELTVADPLTASLLRTYAWNIDKVLTNRAEIAEDETPASVDSEWLVQVTEGAYAESAHQVTGRVIITNPNDYKSYVVDVANGITINGLSCDLPGATGVVVPASQSVELPYSCAGNPGEVYSGEHTIEVTGADIDPIVHAEPVSYGINEAQKTITVTDDKYTFDPAWTIEWTESGKEHVREYTLAVATAAGECQTFTNTASIVETGQQAADSFKACVSDPLDTVSGGASRLSTTGGVTFGGIAALGGLLLAVGATLLVRRRGAAAR